jgi:RNA-directed DNA polymerase
MEGYFDSIEHDKLMACVRIRVVDASVLRLIEQWLEAAWEKAALLEHAPIPQSAGARAREAAGHH